MTQGNTLVCDIGSCSIKVGFAGSLAPAKVIPTVVGMPLLGHTSNKDILYGNDAINACSKEKISLHYPMNEKSEIVDWNSMQALLLHSFKEIGIIEGEFSKHKVLLTKPSGTKRNDFIKLFDFLFKKLGFRAATMHEQAALVLYTQGIETGMVVELGESSVRIVPVYKGHAIPNLDRTMPIGGRSMSVYLMKLLRLRGYHMEARGKYGVETSRQIKETSCYVAYEPEVEGKLARETTAIVDSITLRNGPSFVIGQERFGAPEILFNPGLCDSETMGLSVMIFDTIQKADIDCRVDLYQNIILSGGLSLLPGIRERIQKDLNELYIEKVLHRETSRTPGWEIAVHAPESREFLVFEGAALFADYIQDDRAFWVSQNDFKHQGIGALFDKCQIN